MSRFITKGDRVLAVGNKLVQIDKLPIDWKDVKNHLKLVLNGKEISINETDGKFNLGYINEVTPNPTLDGTEQGLVSLNIGGTNYKLISQQELDNKIDKSTFPSSSLLYKNGQGVITGAYFGPNASSWYTVQRDVNAQINLPNQETRVPSDDQAISKRYLDGRLANIGGELDEEGNLTIKVTNEDGGTIGITLDKEGWINFFGGILDIDRAVIGTELDFDSSAKELTRSNLDVYSKSEVQQMIDNAIGNVLEEDF